MLEVGAKLRIHHMMVEVFSGMPEGRVGSGQWFTVVDGWDGEQHQAHQYQEGGGNELG